jgi:phosphoribosylanthranilate isomerase
MKPRLPDRPKVAVMVTPTSDEFAAASQAGFDLFQVHFPAAEPSSAAAVAAQAGWDRVWFAPRLAPGESIDPALLPLVRTWLLDTCRAEGYGGTGRTGDWTQFRRYRENHPDRTWILAGGLGPDNVGAALAATGARTIDVNSGVERGPGVKDPVKLAALRAALERVASESEPKLR